MQGTGHVYMQGTGHMYMQGTGHTVGAKKNFPLRSGTTYVYFLSVTEGGAFPTVFLSFLRNAASFENAPLLENAQSSRLIMT